MKFIKKNYSFSSIEPFLIIAFWILLFASPLLFGRFSEDIEWNSILIAWQDYIPLLIIFLISRFYLFPKLFLKGKRTLYFSIITILILIATILFYFFADDANIKTNLPPPNQTEFRRNPPPMFNQGELPPPRQQLKPNSQPPIPRFINFIILSILMVGFDTGLQISMRWAKLEQERVSLEKESVENQLAFLKNQVSPHFFMNTLNNIHALVDIDADESKKSIIKLSHLMRHLLYDSEEKTTPIKKEIEFITSYIELMKLRFSNKVKVDVNIPSEIPNKNIPPLLFTSLLENAFKHGISYNKPSFIKISMSFTEDKLLFSIKNSNHPIKTEAASGIGLENTKKRLDLLFKDNFNFKVTETKETYTVNLNIPL